MGAPHIIHFSRSLTIVRLRHECVPHVLKTPTKSPLTDQDIFMTFLRFSESLMVV